MNYGKIPSDTRAHTHVTATGDTPGVYGCACANVARDYHSLPITARQPTQKITNDEYM